MRPTPRTSSSPTATRRPDPAVPRRLGSGSITRPSYWPSDGVWWVAVTVDDANGDAFAAAHVPYTCRVPRLLPQMFATPGPAGPRCRGSSRLLAGDGLPDPAFARRTSWTTITDGVSTSTTYMATGLTNNVNYYFRVAAVRLNGPGDYSSSRWSGRSRAVGSAHGDCHGRAAEPGRQVGRAGEGAPVLHYRVQYSTNRTSWTERGHVGDVAARHRPQPRVRYYFRVLAVNQAATDPCRRCRAPSRRLPADRQPHST